MQKKIVIYLAQWQFPGIPVLDIFAFASLCTHCASIVQYFLANEARGFWLGPIFLYLELVIAERMRRFDNKLLFECDFSVVPFLPFIAVRAVRLPSGL